MSLNVRRIYTEFICDFCGSNRVTAQYCPACGESVVDPEYENVIYSEYELIQPVEDEAAVDFVQQTIDEEIHWSIAEVRNLLGIRPAPRLPPKPVKPTMGDDSKTYVVLQSILILFFIMAIVFLSISIPYYIPARINRESVTLVDKNITNGQAYVTVLLQDGKTIQLKANAEEYNSSDKLYIDKATGELAPPLPRVGFFASGLFLIIAAILFNILLVGAAWQELLGVKEYCKDRRMYKKLLKEYYHGY